MIFNYNYWKKNFKTAIFDYFKLQGPVLIWIKKIQFFSLSLFPFGDNLQGPVAQKPISTNPGLNI